MSEYDPQPPFIVSSAVVFYVGIDEVLHPEVRSDAYAPAPGWSSPVWDRALATGRAAGFDPAGKWSFEVTGEGGAISHSGLCLNASNKGGACDGAVGSSHAVPLA